MKPRPKVPSAKPPIATTLRHARAAASGRAPPPLRSSAARRGAACASRRPRADRGRGRRRSRWIRPPRFRVYSLVGGAYTHSPRLGLHIGAPARPATRSGRSRRSRAVRSGARHRERRPVPPRHARRSTSRGRAASAGSASPCSRSRQPRHPVHVPRALHHARSRSSNGTGRRPSPSTSEDIVAVGLNSVRPGGTSRAGSRRAAAARDRDLAQRAGRIRCESRRCTTT